MKKPIMALAALGIVAAGLAGAGLASAHGLFGGDNLTPEERVAAQQLRFEHEAELLGISIDEVKSAWAEGKRLNELAEEHDISEEDLKAKMQTLHKQKAEEHLQELVDAGVITSAQAEARLSVMEERSDQFEGHHGHRGGRGHHGPGPETES